MQKAATPTYIATAETVNLIIRDPNILTKAAEELNKRYSAGLDRDYCESTFSISRFFPFLSFFFLAHEQ